jgi:hypothetical protein
VTRPSAGPPSEPRAEQVFALTENQYRFGIGPIVIRCVRRLSELVVDGDQWVHVRALVAQGEVAHHGGWDERELDVPAQIMHGISGQRRPDRDR